MQAGSDLDLGTTKKQPQRQCIGCRQMKDGAEAEGEEENPEPPKVLTEPMAS